MVLDIEDQQLLTSQDDFMCPLMKNHHFGKQSRKTKTLNLIKPLDRVAIFI